jgi:hypothetical protein
MPITPSLTDGTDGSTRGLLEHPHCKKMPIWDATVAEVPNNSSWGWAIISLLSR